MGYPLNSEGYVNAEAMPDEPLSEDLESAGQLEVDEAGVEVAPPLSAEAIEAVERLAARQHEQHDAEDA